MQGPISRAKTNTNTKKNHQTNNSHYLSLQSAKQKMSKNPSLKENKTTKFNKLTPQKLIDMRIKKEMNPLLHLTKHTIYHLSIHFQRKIVPFQPSTFPHINSHPTFPYPNSK
jgi:hypothetical protein